MTEQATVSAEGLEFILSLQAASQANLSATQNTLHDLALRDVIKACETIVKLDTILNSATVIDRETERRLRGVYPNIDSAYRMLKHAKQMLGKSGESS